MRLGVALSLCLSLSACAAHEEPDESGTVVAPTLAPPPAYEDRTLTRDQALAVTQSAEEPGDAIRELDSRPFEFKLDEQTLGWFGEQGVDPTVLDYLRKRSKVDWSSLRGDVDPDSPR